MDSVRNFGEITIYTYTVGLLKMNHEVTVGLLKMNHEVTVGLLKMNHEVTVGLLKMNREVKQIVRRFLSRSRFY